MVFVGRYATIAQVLIIREFLVVFFGSELRIGIILGTWPFGVASGAAAGGWVAGRFKNHLPFCGLGVPYRRQAVSYAQRRFGYDCGHNRLRGPRGRVYWCLNYGCAFCPAIRDIRIMRNNSSVESDEFVVPYTPLLSEEKILSLSGRKNRLRFHLIIRYQENFLVPQVT